MHAHTTSHKNNTPHNTIAYAVNDVSCRFNLIISIKMFLSKPPKDWGLCLQRYKVSYCYLTHNKVPKYLSTHSPVCIKPIHQELENTQRIKFISMDHMHYKHTLLKHHMWMGMFVWAHVYVCVYVCVYIYICVCVCVCVCTHVCVCGGGCVSVCMCMYMCVRVYECVSLCVRMWLSLCVHMCVCVRTCMCVNIFQRKTTHF